MLKSVLYLRNRSAPVRELMGNNSLPKREPKPYTDFMWCSVLCICGQFCRFYQHNLSALYVILYDLLHNEKAEFIYLLLYILPRNLV